MFVPTASAALILGSHHRTKEEWDAINKAQAEESNRKYFLKVREEMPKAIEETGLFNTTVYIEPDGINCLLTLKKYPNVWAEFNHTLRNLNSTVTFQCYINEHKWVKTEITLLDFLQMIGFREITKKSLLYRIFHKKENKKDFGFTSDKLMSLVEKSIETQGYNLTPGKLRIETEEYLSDWDKEFAKKYSTNSESVIYYFNQQTNSIETHSIKFDKIQMFLIKTFINK